MRLQIASALLVLALHGCGFAPLEGPLDPVPEGELSFLVDEGNYDVHYVTESTTCPELELLDQRWTSFVGSSVDGTPAFTFDGPSPFIGWPGRSGVERRYVSANPTTGSAGRGYPLPIEALTHTWIERAGPGFLELRLEEEFVSHACERVSRLTLTLQD